MNKRAFSLLSLLAAAALLAACGSQASPAPEATPAADLSAYPAQEAPKSDGQAAEAYPGQTDVSVPAEAEAYPVDAVAALSCAPGSGLAAFLSEENQFCFLYPERFTLDAAEAATGHWQVNGPAVEGAADPGFARLNVALSPAQGDLNAAAEAVAAEAPDAARTQLVLGGQSAERFDGATREVLAVYNGRVYRLTFTPAVADGAPTNADLEELYQAVVSSFQFAP